MKEFVLEKTEKVYVGICFLNMKELMGHKYNRTIRVKLCSQIALPCGWKKLLIIIFLRFFESVTISGVARVGNSRRGRRCGIDHHIGTNLQPT